MSEDRHAPGYYEEYYRSNREQRLAYAREYYARNKQRIRERARLARYGIDAETYAVLYEIQRGVCAICGTNDPGGTNNAFAVDHDHKTGAVRGLLCQRCNQGLGHFRDRPDVLIAASEYLRGTLPGVTDV